MIVRLQLSILAVPFVTADAQLCDRDSCLNMVIRVCSVPFTRSAVHSHRLAPGDVPLMSMSHVIDSCEGCLSYACPGLSRPKLFCSFGSSSPTHLEVIDVQVHVRLGHAVSPIASSIGSVGTHWQHDFSCQLR
ncbi:hypothetical protein V8C35DRAFT_18600 [Trichoderma chlorosporum]